MEIEVVETGRGRRFLWIKKVHTWGEPIEYMVDILSAPMSCEGEQIRHYRSDGTSVKSGSIRWDGPHNEYMPKFCWGGNTPFLNANAKQFQVGDKLTITAASDRPEGRHFELRLWLEMTHEIAFTWGIKGLYEEPSEEDEDTDGP